MKNTTKLTPDLPVKDFITKILSERKVTIFSKTKNPYTRIVKEVRMKI